MTKHIPVAEDFHKCNNSINNLLIASQYLDDMINNKKLKVFIYSA